MTAFVSLIGLADSIYLAVEHLSGRSVRCTITSGCSEVLSSPYASIRGFPLAGLGAVTYFVVFSLATLAAFGYRFVGKLLTLIVTAMFLTTLWLLYLQAFVIPTFLPVLFAVSSRHHNSHCTYHSCKKARGALTFGFAVYVHFSPHFAGLTASSQPDNLLLQFPHSIQFFTVFGRNYYP